MNWFFLTLAYSGLTPKAPGTAGSFVALLLGMAILVYFDTTTLFLAATLVSIIAIRVINDHEQKVQQHDDSRIVIDELAGMWFALSIAPAYGVVSSDILDLPNGFLLQSVLSFILFRYFDISKPSIIGRIDREAPGGVGVMGDDIIAGIAAGICSSAIWQIYEHLQDYLI